MLPFSCICKLERFGAGKGRVCLRWWKCQRNCVKWLQNTLKDVKNVHYHMQNLMFFPQVLTLTHESGIPSGPCRWAGHWCGCPWTVWTKLKSSGTSLAEQKNTPSGEWRPVWPSYQAPKHLKFTSIRHKSSRQMVQWDGRSTMLMQAGWVVYIYIGIAPQQWSISNLFCLLYIIILH